MKPETYLTPLFLFAYLIIAHWVWPLLGYITNKAKPALLGVAVIFFSVMYLLSLSFAVASLLSVFVIYPLLFLNGQIQYAAGIVLISGPVICACGFVLIGIGSIGSHSAVSSSRVDRFFDWYLGGS